MAIDLTGSFFNIAQQKIGRGQDLNLDFSVVNNGDEDIQNFSFDIVISTDGNIDANDRKIGNYEIVGGLQAGQDSGLKSYRYATPDANSPFWMDEDNTYTVGIRLDPQNDFFETNEDNNSNQGIGVDFDTVEVIDFGESDLVASSASVANEIVPGGKVDLSFSVKNDSEAMANPVSVDVYLSADDSISEGDVKLGTYDIRHVINAGEDSGVKRYVYQAPELGNALWSQGDGDDYRVILDIDPNNEVKETNEDNNTGLAATSVSGVNDAADLVVSGFSAPEGLEAGKTVEVEYEITNSGNSSADLFGAGFYLFTEEYLAENDNLSVDDVPEVYFLQGDRDSSLISLEAGESTKMTTELTIPEEWTGFSGPGDYYLGAEADAFDDVVERSDANNSLTGVGVDYQKVNISNAPVNDTVDLVGTHFEVVQEQIVPGQLFDLGFTIANEGEGEADPFAFDLYLSDDATITEEDTYLGTYNYINSLAGGEDTGLKSARYTAPEADNALWDGDGEYYAGMIIDPENDIAETNEGNNSNQGKGLDYSSTLVTGLDTIADLTTEGEFKVAPETVKTGETFEVTYTINNTGDAAADLFAAGFYLFSEEYLETNDSLMVEDVPKVYLLQGDRESSLINLEAGESVTMTTELTMPEDWAGFNSGSGDYLVGVAADPFGDVIESNEMNNSLNGIDMDYAKVNVEVI